MKIKVEAVQHMLSLEAGKWTKLKSNAVHAVVTSDGFTVIDLVQVDGSAFVS